jgi:mono/diheme cytochrome c family protein
MAIGMALVLLFSGFAVWVGQRADRTFAGTLPALRAVRDSSAVARGRYLVLGPGHCADCHAPPEQKPKVDSGLVADLSGGYALRTFLGDMRATNITPDSLTGIGSIRDGELARFLRTGIDHRGRVGLPVMMYADLSDADVVSILSYLRQLRPIRNPVPPSRYNFLGKITKAFFLEPFAPDSSLRPVPDPGVTEAYGRYLANAVSNCAACHTARNMKTGEFTGPRFAGGLVFRKSGSPETIAISPNLTPDAMTGAITGWSRERFIARFRSGNLREWSPMPWGPFGRMTDADLGALHLYLSSLEPVQHETFHLAKEAP